MLKQFIVILCFHLCFSKSVDVTFKNVTFRVYSMYTEKQKTIIPSSNSLKNFLPEIAFDKIEVVEQNIPVLYENSLANLDDLDELVIEHCNVREVRPGALLNVPLLRRLSFKGNKLEEIKDGVFSSLGLSTLDLSFNSITRIESGAFDNMPNILNINLADNKISSWNKNWFHNTPLLTRISMQNNLIESLPDEAFKNLKGIKKFGSVDLTINLVLSHNKIKIINTKTFSGLYKINNLWLDNNLLENFDEDLLDHVVVNDLRINNNKIVCLEGDFNKIFKADVTHIDSNPIDCECLGKIKTWVKKNFKQVDFFYVDMECTAQRIKTKIVALEKRLNEIHNTNNDVNN